jgi:hypothetical protein
MYVCVYIYIDMYTYIHRVHDIPVDAAGRPIMPLQLGTAMMILSLGSVKPPPYPTFLYIIYMYIIYIYIYIYIYI